MTTFVSNFIPMGRISLILTLVLFLTGCSKEDKLNHFVFINGKLIREMTNQPVAGKKLRFDVYEMVGSGFWAYRKEIDSGYIITDENGSFEAIVKSTSNARIVITKGRDDYTDFSIERKSLTDSFILTTNKYLNFAIHVINVSPVDSNDRIYIDFYSRYQQSFLTKIENFGIPNLHIPGENGFGDADHAQWTGMDVNSIAYYIVPENAENFKLFWIKRKAGIESQGVTDEIPYDTASALNTYIFEY